MVAKALYDYNAAIPEECDFRKGDLVIVTKTQDDGWWVGEITESRQRGLVPRYALPLTPLTIAISLKRSSKISVVLFQWGRIGFLESFKLIVNYRVCNVLSMCYPRSAQPHSPLAAPSWSATCHHGFRTWC
jgi:SH3 domain